MPDRLNCRHVPFSPVDQADTVPALRGDPPGERLPLPYSFAGLSGARGGALLPARALLARGTASPCSIESQFTCGNVAKLQATRRRRSAGFSPLLAGEKRGSGTALRGVVVSPYGNLKSGLDEAPRGPR